MDSTRTGLTWTDLQAWPEDGNRYVHEREYTEPDVLFVRADRVGLFEQRRIAAPPDLVVEVSSPSTRHRDLGAKRDLYERFGVPEYWFVDLDRDRLVVHRLAEGGYGEPAVYERGDTVSPLAAPGLVLPLDRILGEPQA
jgi:Uma2 family endonuclease